MGAIFDNPISSAQLQLRGGWKTLFITTGAYALIVAVAMGLWSETDPNHLQSAAEVWTVILLVLQVFLVVLFSILRIAGAVRQDNTSGIMESHRLMPMTGVTACVGFMVGPSIQMLAIGLVSCAAGLVTCSVAGFQPARWLMANGILLAFLGFAAAYGVLVGFYRRALFNVVIVVLVVGLLSRGLLLYAVPATAVLFSPLAGETIFNMRGNGELYNSGMLWAFLGQALLGGIFLAAAARKFRQPDRPAFSISLSLCLLTAWVVLNLAAVLQWGSFEPSFLRYNMGSSDDRMTTQFTGSALTAILLSLLPIAAAIRAQRERSDRLFTGDASNHPRAASRVITILACIALVCLLLVVPILTNGTTPG